MRKGKWPETRGEVGFQNKTGSYETKTPRQDKPHRGVTGWMQLQKQLDSIRMWIQSLILIEWTVGARSEGASKDSDWKNQRKPLAALSFSIRLLGSGWGAQTFSPSHQKVTAEVFLMIPSEVYWAAQLGGDLRAALEPSGGISYPTLPSGSPRMRWIWDTPLGRLPPQTQAGGWRTTEEWIDNERATKC